MSRQKKKKKPRKSPNTAKKKVQVSTSESTLMLDFN